MSYMHQKAVLAAPTSPAPILPPGDTPHNGSVAQTPVRDANVDADGEDEVVEGEYTEDQGASLTPAQRIAATPRPWPPDLLKEALLYNAAKKASKGVTGLIDDATRKAVTGKLDDMLDGDPGQRVVFIAFVFGVDGSPALSQAQGEALEGWLAGNGHVSDEAHALVEVASMVWSRLGCRFYDRAALCSPVVF